MFEVFFCSHNFLPQGGATSSHHVTDVVTASITTTVTDTMQHYCHYHH